MTRSSIVLDVNGKQITLKGEAFLPGFGSPDFLISKNSFLRWDNVSDGNLSPDDKEIILETLASDFKSKGLVFEVEK